MSKFIAFLKVIFFVLNCLWVILLQGLLMLFTKGQASYYMPLIWHRLCCLIFGIRVNVKGKIHRDAQTIYMSNHISYLDISALGSLIKASFVAKSEVEGWPLFGFLADLQQTAYIRRSRTKIAKEKNILLQRIDNGESLIIFPEGTSTSGFEVIPFKSSLFALAMGDGRDNIYIQPITIRVAQVDGKLPETKNEQDIYAWPRDVDIDLHHHLWRFAKTSGATLDVIFHEPLKASNFENRKILAKACYDSVSKGLDIPSEKNRTA